MLRISIAIVPAGLIFVAYWIMKKKYIITEAYYEEITAKVKERKAAPQA
ncbi:MAG: hypothetical protein MZU97_17370 [Bacillus subtilis]|nr:hypothetical protein [Bacillus subtilis]